MASIDKIKLRKIELGLKMLSLQIVALELDVSDDCTTSFVLKCLQLDTFKLILLCEFYLYFKNFVLHSVVLGVHKSSKKWSLLLVTV
jgi:hypothetical protein